MTGHANRMVPLVFLLPVLGWAQAAPDTTGWECKFCPFPTGHELNFDVGAGFVSDDDFRFGDYRGFDEDGAIFLGDIDLRGWYGEGGRWSITGRDLGLDSRELDARWSAPGFRLDLSWNQLPRQIYGTSVSPFTGLDNLSLPAGWVNAGSTAGMTELAGNSNLARIGHDRETFGFDLLALDPADKLQYQVSYRRDNRDGLGIHGGSYISQSVLLPEPIDYSTDRFDASVTYTGDRGHARLAYYVSMFDNKAPVLTWDNPFTPLVLGANTGTAALAPDNEAHQLSLSGAIRLAPRTRLSALYSIGSLEQNDAFAPYTANPSLVTSDLPAGSLDGEVETRRLNLRLTTRLNKRLRVRADVNVDDRKNQTPRNDYDTVESDLFLAGIRRNVPYGFKRTTGRVRGDYKVDRKLTVSSGYRYQEMERSFQEVRDTTESSGWFSARLRQDGELSAVSLKIGHDERDGSVYLMPGDPLTAQNPLLRKYYLADRDRDYVQASLSLAPTDRLDIDLAVEKAREDYDETLLGLLDTNAERINIDSNLRLTEKANLAIYYGREELENTQTGSAAFATPDWTANSEDVTDTFSIGLQLPQFRDKLDLGLEYVFSDSTGRIALSSAAAPIDNFPDLRSTLRSVRLYADLRPAARYDLRLAYYYEKLETDNWMLDGLAPATLPSLLALGAESPDYSGGIFSLMFRYSLASGTE